MDMAHNHSQAVGNKPCMSLRVDFIKSGASLSLSALFERLRTAVDYSAQLLSPRGQHCALCDRLLLSANSSSITIAASVYASLPVQFRQSLCGPCLSGIPWLLRIKCSVCGRGIKCEDCLRRMRRYFVYNRSAVSYDDMMRGWLARYKYRGDERLSFFIAQMLQPAFEQLTAEIAAETTIQTRSSNRKRLNSLNVWDAVTYVPISKERARERGFNQAEQLASHLAKTYRLPLYSFLYRSRHTEKMSFKSRSERLRDASTLFTPNDQEFQRFKTEKERMTPSCPIAGKTHRILLVDDIYTTGSTANACSRTLKLYFPAPLDVYVLTWARS